MKKIAVAAQLPKDVQGEAHPLSYYLEQGVTACQDGTQENKARAGYNAIAIAQGACGGSMLLKSFCRGTLLHIVPEVRRVQTWRFRDLSLVSRSDQFSVA